MLGCSLGVFIQIAIEIEIAIESVPLIADPDPDPDSDLVRGNSGFGCTKPTTRVFGYC